MGKKWMACAALAAFLAMGGVAAADEITDAIQEGLRQYQAGEFTQAAQSLDFAAQLVRQKKGGELQSLLPKPLDGWTAEDAENQAMAGAYFGGGVAAQRNYTKNPPQGVDNYEPATVSLQIVTDSPAMQGLMMMLSNPMYATADGGKLTQIAGQRAVVKYDSSARSGSIRMAVANRFMVTLEGNAVTQEELTEYAKKIDYAKLSALP